MRGSRFRFRIFQNPLTNDGAFIILSMPDEFLTGYPLCGIGVRIRAVRTFLLFGRTPCHAGRSFGSIRAFRPAEAMVTVAHFKGVSLRGRIPGSHRSQRAEWARRSSVEKAKNDRPQNGRSNAKPHSHDSPRGAPFQRYSYFARSGRRCSRLWAFYPPAQ